MLAPLYAPAEVHPSKEARIRSHYDAVAPLLFKAAWYHDPDVTQFVTRHTPVFTRHFLDLCSGPGLLAKSILTRHPEFEYHMIDISAVACEMALAVCKQYSQAKVFQGNWVFPVSARKVKYDVILIKNALHLIIDLPNKLNYLRSILKPAGRIVFVETVSPSDLANNFIRDIFKVAAFDYKEYYFTEFSLVSMLRQAGLRRLGGKHFIDQEMTIHEWLEQKRVPKLRQEAVFSRIYEASRNPKLLAQMRLKNTHDRGKLTMLRRQYCSVFRF